jgi:GNAT superfamily N-acetyltransferase
MPDMLVKLYELPDPSDALVRVKELGIAVRRAIAPEKNIVAKWVGEVFGSSWKSECEVSFSNHPVSCWIAVENDKIIGFSCYDSTCRDFFGPVGVDPSARDKGVGKALLLKCLYDMEAQGYAYAIIGGAGPTDFYKKAVNAVIIDGSVPGVYRGMLKSEE